jgi:hypothetical protein
VKFARCEQWELIADSVYNLRKSLLDCKLVDDSTCKCKNHKDAFALRRALTCAREDGQKYDKPICANNLCRDCRDLGKLMSLMCEAEWAHVKGETTLTAQIWRDIIMGIHHKGWVNAEKERLRQKAERMEKVQGVCRQFLAEVSGTV